MTGGQIAALIAALAFLLLVVFLGVFLLRAAKSLGVITSDVDQISREVEEILANANELLTDVNGKVKTIDPAFKAVGDLGESVSSLNEATRNLTARVGNVHAGRGLTGLAIASKFSKSAFQHYRNRKVRGTKK